MTALGSCGFGGTWNDSGSLNRFVLCRTRRS